MDEEKKIMLTLIKRKQKKKEKKKIRKKMKAEVWKWKLVEPLWKHYAGTSKN